MNSERTIDDSSLIYQRIKNFLNIVSSNKQHSIIRIADVQLRL